jgi:hypothetical protein
VDTWDLYWQINMSKNNASFLKENRMQKHCSASQKTLATNLPRSGSTGVWWLAPRELNDILLFPEKEAKSVVLLRRKPGYKPEPDPGFDACLLWDQIV